MPRPSVVAKDPKNWQAVADYVAAVKAALDLNQTDLVELSGVSQSVVSKIENARPDNGKFAVDSLRRVALALLLHPDALMQLAWGWSLEEVGEQSEAYWNFCEESGGWENMNPVPLRRIGDV